MTARTHSLVLCCSLALLLLTACGSSSSTTRRAKTDRTEGAAAPAAEKPKKPTFDGRRVTPGEEFELQGFYDGVAIRGTDIVVHLRRTEWTELDMEGTSFREGEAEVDLDTAAGTEVVKIDLDEAHPVGDGYEVVVTYVGDTYDERGRTIPIAKFVVRKAGTGR